MVAFDCSEVESGGEHEGKAVDADDAHEFEDFVDGRNETAADDDEGVVDDGAGVVVAVGNELKVKPSR